MMLIVCPPATLIPALCLYSRLTLILKILIFIDFQSHRVERTAVQGVEAVRDANRVLLEQGGHPQDHRDGALHQRGLPAPLRHVQNYQGGHLSQGSLSNCPSSGSLPPASALSPLPHAPFPMPRSFPLTVYSVALACSSHSSTSPPGTLCNLLGYWDGIPMLTFALTPIMSKIMPIMPKNR